MVFCQLVWDPLYGDLSCMQFWARILKTNVFDMYASCTFSLCVLHPFSCNLLLAVITDVSFVAFEWSAASWIMFSAYPAFMEVTCPICYYCSLLHCLQILHKAMWTSFWFFPCNVLIFVYECQVLHYIWTENFSSSMLQYYFVEQEQGRQQGSTQHSLGKDWCTSYAKSGTVGLPCCQHIHSVQQLLTWPSYNPETCMVLLVFVANVLCCHKWVGFKCLMVMRDYMHLYHSQYFFEQHVCHH